MQLSIILIYMQQIDEATVKTKWLNLLNVPKRVK